MLRHGFILRLPNLSIEMRRSVAASGREEILGPAATYSLGTPLTSMAQPATKAGTPTPMPEPSMIAMLFSGFIAAGSFGRRLLRSWKAKTEGLAEPGQAFSSFHFLQRSRDCPGVACLNLWRRDLNIGHDV